MKSRTETTSMCMLEDFDKVVEEMSRFRSTQAVIPPLGIPGYKNFVTAVIKKFKNEVLPLYKYEKVISREKYYKIVSTDWLLYEVTWTVFYQREVVGPLIESINRVRRLSGNTGVIEDATFQDLERVIGSKKFASITVFGHNANPREESRNVSNLDETIEKMVKFQHMVIRPSQAVILIGIPLSKERFINEAKEQAGRLEENDKERCPPNSIEMADRIWTPDEVRVVLGKLSRDIVFHITICTEKSLANELQENSHLLSIEFFNLPIPPVQAMQRYVEFLECLDGKTPVWVCQSR